MPYTVPLDRAHPGAIVLLLDQSDSMNDSYGSGEATKAEVLARLVNRLLRDLVIRSERGDELLDYYEIAVIGYKGKSAESAFGGQLAGQFLVPISTIANYPLRMERESLPERPDVVVERPVWIEPMARGATPMKTAIDLAGGIVVDWANNHTESFPPLVVNITDGMPTDGDPKGIASQLRNVRTNDGALLLFNVHISESNAASIEFPVNGNNLPDRFARQLFDMSSPLTHYMRMVGSNMGKSMPEGCRGFMFNADPSQLAEFLDIGTRVSLDLER